MLWRPVTRGNGNILGEATAAGSGAFSGEAIRPLILIVAPHRPPRKPLVALPGAASGQRRTAARRSQKAGCWATGSSRMLGLRKIGAWGITGQTRSVGPDDGTG